MFNYTFSGTAVLLGMVGLCVSTGIAVYLLRRFLRHSVDPAGGTLRPDVFALSPAVHRFSLCAALFLSFLTLNWTRYEAAPVYAATTIEVDELIEQVPITAHKPTPPPPPPPPPVIEPVPDEEAPSVEQLDQSITEEEPVFADAPVLSPPERPTAPPPPPPAPTPPPPVDRSPVIMAERMPVFTEECAALSGEARKSCSDRALLNFVSGHVDYPSMARNNRVEGTVVIRFVVETDGSVSGVEALREVPAGCTEAALRAVKAINDSGQRFTPGIQAGRPVRVYFNLPVKFQLQ